MRIPDLDFAQFGMQDNDASGGFIDEKVAGDDGEWEAREGVRECLGGDDGEFAQDGEA